MPEDYQDGDGAALADEIDVMFTEKGGLPSIEEPPLLGPTPNADAVEEALKHVKPPLPDPMATSEYFGLNEDDLETFRGFLRRAYAELLDGPEDVTEESLTSMIKQIISDAEAQNIAYPPTAKKIAAHFLSNFTVMQPGFHDPEDVVRVRLVINLLNTFLDREPS